MDAEGGDSVDEAPGGYGGFEGVGMIAGGLGAAGDGFEEDVEGCGGFELFVFVEGAGEHVLPEGGVLVGEGDIGLTDGFNGGVGAEGVEGLGEAIVAFFGDGLEELFAVGEVAVGGVGADVEFSGELAEGEVFGSAAFDGEESGLHERLTERSVMVGRAIRFSHVDIVHIDGIE